MKIMKVGTQRQGKKYFTLNKHKMWKRKFGVLNTSDVIQ